MEAYVFGPPMLLPTVVLPLRVVNFPHNHEKSSRWELLRSPLLPGALEVVREGITRSVFLLPTSYRVPKPLRRIS